MVFAIARFFDLHGVFFMVGFQLTIVLHEAIAVVQRELAELYRRGALKSAYIFPVNKLWGICCHSIDGQSFTMVKDRGSYRDTQYEVRLFSTINAAYSALSRVGFKQMLVTDKEPVPSKTDKSSLKNVVIKQPVKRKNRTADLFTGEALSA